MALVEDAAGVGHVVHAFEVAGAEVRAGHGDELVDEEVVDVREGFDGRGGGVRGEGHAGLEDLVRGGRAVVEDRVHEGHGSLGGGVCGEFHGVREREGCEDFVGPESEA